MLSDAFGQHQDRMPTHGYAPTREELWAKVGDGVKG
jgi:hypothetical protein